MQNKIKNFNKNKKFNKQHYNKKTNKYPYSSKNKYKYPYSYRNKNSIYYLLGEKKPLKPLTTTYLHRNKKIKTGIFFKEPTFKNILYPFYLNLNLINEYLKKK